MSDTSVQRQGWDNVLTVSGSNVTVPAGTLWDGTVKNLIYDTSSMEWIAQTSSASGAAIVDQGAGGASAWLVTASSWPLPTGASTLAEQQSQTTLLARAFSTGSWTRPSINNSSSTILSSNSSRKYALVTNNNGFTAYLKLGAAAVVNEGIPLPPNSSYMITRDNLWTGDIRAIKSTSTSASLDVFEGT